jgi:hypothetical protein
VIFEHNTLPSFWKLYKKLYNKLPEDIRRRADKQFELMIGNPAHPSVQLKPVGEFWSARVTDAVRVLALREKNVFTWFWIGSHDEYEGMLKA